MELYIRELKGRLATHAGKFVVDWGIPLSKYGRVVVVEGLTKYKRKISPYGWKIVPETQEMVLIPWIDPRKRIIKTRMVREERYATFPLYLPAPAFGGFSEIIIEEEYKDKMIVLMTPLINPAKQRSGTKALISVMCDDFIPKIKYKMVGYFPFNPRKAVTLEGEKVIAKFSNPQKWDFYTVKISEIRTKFREPTEEELAILSEKIEEDEDD